jgi:hypothetical protein
LKEFLNRKGTNLNNPNNEDRENLINQLMENCEHLGTAPIKLAETLEGLYDQCLASAALRYWKEEFKPGQTQALLMTMTFSYQNDIYLPPWAHNQLSEAATSYFENEGKIRFDKLLNVSSGPRGRNPYTKRKDDEIKAAILKDMLILNKCLKFSIPVSCYVVKKRFATVRPVTRGRIHDIYKEAKKQYPPYEVSAGDLSLGDFFFVSPYRVIIDNSVEELKEAGLYKSAIKTVNKLCK